MEGQTQSIQALYLIDDCVLLSSQEHRLNLTD